MTEREERHPFTSDSPIVVEGLTKKFKDFVAVDHVSFAVSSGEVYGWLGPNGAGKTTTIRMLLGLLRPTEGRAWVLGYDCATQAKAMQIHVGYMSQLFTLYNDLTPVENIRFYGEAYGLDRRTLRRRQDEILAMAGLHGREKVLTAHLSGGWKQRLALGCAIVHNPRVLFLDEPTAGVDPISRRQFWELIYAMARQGVTVLVTTHYMDEAELCHRVGFIADGRLIALDTPRRLKELQMRGEVLEVACAEPARAVSVLGRLAGFDEVALYGAMIHVVAPGVEAYCSQIGTALRGAGIHVRAMNVIAPSLEDVFISCVRSSAARAA